MIETAKFLLKMGINVVATNGKKQAMHSWASLQGQLAKAEDLPEMFRRATGLATINGRISGGLMVLDFEGASHGVECMFEPWIRRLRTESGALAKKLVFHTTGGGGVHVRFRCPDDVRSNQDLAKTKDDKVLIELRGEGGYTLCPPSPGYEWVVGDLDSLSVITSSELNYLVDGCRKLDRSGIQSKINPEPITIPKSEDADLRLRKSFNQSEEWRSILERHGWEQTKVDREGIEHWVRPGKTGNDGPSATWSAKENRGQCGARRLHIFSSNAAPLEAERSYTPFQLHQQLECGGGLLSRHPILVSCWMGARDRRR